MSFYHDVYDALLRGNEVVLEANGVGEPPNPNTVRIALSRIHADLKRSLGDAAPSKSVKITKNADCTVTVRLVTISSKTARFTVRPANSEEGSNHGTAT